MAVIYYLDITDIDNIETYVHEFSDILPEEIRKISFFKSKKKKQSTMAWILLAYGVKRMGKNVDLKSDIMRNPYGKPRLKDSFLKFNLSHSENFVACAISQKWEVGIDIQRKRKIPLKILEGFLGERDYRMIESFLEEDEWCRLWTRKEALLKCTGMGWRYPEARKIDVADKKITLNDTTYFVTDIWIRDEYDFSVCIKNRDEKIIWFEVQKYEIDQFGKERSRSVIFRDT